MSHDKINIESRMRPLAQMTQATICHCSIDLACNRLPTISPVKHDVDPLTNQNPRLTCHHYLPGFFACFLPVISIPAALTVTFCRSFCMPPRYGKVAYFESEQRHNFSLDVILDVIRRNSKGKASSIYAFEIHWIFHLAYLSQTIRSIGSSRWLRGKL